MTKCNRFAGPHIDTPEVDLSLFRHNILHQVKVAYGNTAGSNDQIVRHRIGELLAQTLHRIARHAQAMRFCSCFSYRGFEQITVAIAYLARLQWLVHVDHFVACSQDGYTGTLYHRYCCPAYCRQNANFPGTNFGPSLQHFLSTTHIFSGRANIISRRHLLQNLYPFTTRPLGTRQFYLYDAVGAWRDRCAGHDAHGCTLLYRVIRYIAGCDPSGYAQTCSLPGLLVAVPAEQRKPI